MGMYGEVYNRVQFLVIHHRTEPIGNDEKSLVNMSLKLTNYKATKEKLLLIAK